MTDKFAYLLLLVAASLFLCAAPQYARAQQPKTPFNDGVLHEGVMGCYGSTCHSRQEATGMSVRQNEILMWQDDVSVSGAHLRAFKTLRSDRSARISERLGYGPAFEAPQCLSCHTDNVGKSLRGKKFQASDGIGCESCHGGAGGWLTQHYNKGASHAGNVARGLYPLEDAQTRAGVCLSCHLGSEAEGQFVTHRMMAAGHPRMSFELDLFTELQSHHSEDVDYGVRKKIQTGARIWAIGQASALKTQLRLFQNPSRNKDGIFPELVFFDCLACHRTISDDPDWMPLTRSNPGRPDTPGIVKFNDSSMIMLLATARQIAPDLATVLDGQIRAFHEALASGGTAQERAAAALTATADKLIARIETTNFTKTQTLDILDIVVAEALARRYTDYVAAEQAVMAIDTLLSSMIAANQVSRADVGSLRDDIERAYTAVDNPDTYDQDQLTAALRALRTGLKSLR